MSNRQYDSNGWYEIKRNPISKSGVFPYSGRAIGDEDTDKVFMVYRPPEELANTETIESFKLLPGIDEHPHTLLGNAKDGLVKPEDKGIDMVIGELVEYDANTETLYSNIKFFTNKILKLIEAGKKELSAGFRCKYEKASGVFNGQAYDYIQREIRGNHLALVDKGRMGSDVAVLDSFTFTFDAKELIKMEDIKTEVKDELTLESLAASIKMLSDKIDGMGKKDEAVVEVDDMAKDMEVKTEEVAKDTEMKEAEVATDKSGMDAMEKRIKAVEAENAALKKNGIKSILSTIAQRDTLVKKLTPHIGAFDSAEKTLDEVAAYGVTKLGIKCNQGHEVAALDGFFAARKDVGVTFSLDSANKPANDSFIDRHLANIK